MPQAVPPFARREVGIVAGLLGATLLALSGRYGYHRDELYFLEAGRHLSWGYPDQPPLVPLLARLMDAIAPGSLVVLRLPSTLAAAAVVLIAGLIAREFGARPSGQTVAAAATALCGFVVATGHLLSTATFSLLGSVVITLLVVRILRTGGTARRWLWLGVVSGMTMQANVIVLGLLVAVFVGIAIVGPRRLLADTGPYVAGLIALALVSPYLVWQAVHGFPQLDVARSIASGGSGSSQSRAAFLPLQFLQVGPFLTPLWVVGLVRVWRDRAWRALGLAYVVLALALLVGGGKPYYLSGFYPMLLAAGAQPLLDHARRWIVPVLLVASLPVIVIVLPVLPTRDAGPTVTVNYDTGETIGWPSYVEQIAAAYRSLPAGTAILTQNYGEAGAVDRYGPGHGLPAAYSGHNAFGRWGPPPASRPVLAIGITMRKLRAECTSVRALGRLHEVDGIDNDENGAPLDFCASPIGPWRGIWPRFVHLG